MTKGVDLAIAINPGADASAALVRADVLVLLREKRYEEALALLYQARAGSPGSSELQKGIDQIKEFLVGAYAKRLGGLDQIARVMQPTAGRSPDVVLLSRYIDGTSTYGDLAQICPLGRLRTLQVLIEMYPPASGQTARPGSDREVPYSGPRPLDSSTDVAMTSELKDPSGERAPDTARSPSSASRCASAIAVEPVVASTASGPLEAAEDRQYREAFALGTAAYIQRRFAEAVAAFEACARLRVGDGPASIMLRRARRDLESS
jgi:hypothetical protein